MGSALNTLAAVLVAVAPATRDVVPVYVSPNASTGVDYAWQSSGPGDALRSLGVFHSPQRLTDVLPADAVQFASLTGGARHARLLLSRGAGRIYAWPGKDGTACYYLRFGGGACTPALRHGAFPVVDPRRAVWGLLGDTATRVDVKLAHVTLRATLGRNAFYLRLPRGTVIPRNITVTDRDGSRHVYLIERCSPDKLLTTLPAGPLAPPPGC